MFSGGPAKGVEFQFQNSAMPNTLSLSQLPSCSPSTRESSQPKYFNTRKTPSQGLDGLCPAVCSSDLEKVSGPQRGSCWNIRYKQGEFTLLLVPVGSPDYKTTEIQGVYPRSVQGHRGEHEDQRLGPTEASASF